MAITVNTVRFDRDDARGLAFFQAHGFVVLRGVLGAAERDLVEQAWDEVVAAGARESGMSPQAFATRFPQNRDLWKKHVDFEHLLFNTGQGSLATRFLGTSGVRLFHDHAISKPVNASNTIPWHQDGAYWPLDRVGLSIWTPTTDVTVDGGCLEVLDGSHLEGPRAPQDFLDAGTSVSFEGDRRLTALPVSSGESVVLHGLTWHRSRPNVVTGRRLAYLTLWVPATARFRPEHASWHPSARHVPVAPGDRLHGAWFPLFGDVSETDEGERVAFPCPPRKSGPSMFTASKDIAGQVEWLLRKNEGEEPSNIDSVAIRERVVEACISRGILAPTERQALMRVLEDLHLNDEVRKRSVARDVYLQAPLRWWTLVGTRVAEEMDRDAG
jgi:ectoine hydroxylase-related dioxygenase (phytanoyl-CoA dioxygenase family)